MIDSDLLAVKDKTPRCINTYPYYEDIFNVYFHFLASHAIFVGEQDDRYCWAVREIITRYSLSATVTCRINSMGLAKDRAVSHNRTVNTPTTS